MEQQPRTIRIERELKIPVIKSTSFPEGLGEVHRRVQQLLNGRHETVYAFSRPENGTIQYYAGAEGIEGTSVITLKAGVYYYTVVEDFHTKPQGISDAFEALLSLPGIHPEGYCVERYFEGKDAECLVLLK